MAVQAAAASLALALALAVAAPLQHCSNASCSILASSYKQSCARDSDCVAVYSGSVCDGSCACENAAINVASQAQYESDLAAASPPECPCPAPPPVTCAQGVCELAGGDGGTAVETCRGDGGLWYCPGSPQGVPTCPGITNPDTPCAYDGGTCFFCSLDGPPDGGGSGTGASCKCDVSQSAALDAGDGGTTWSCIASNFLCQ
jgi:hypothetical protein